MTLTKYSGAYEELFSNCIALWNNSKVGVSGTTIFNIINSGTYDATLTGTPLTSTDRFGIGTNTLQCTGSNYISIAHNAIFNIGSGNMTIAIWVKPYTLSGNYVELVGKGARSGSVSGYRSWNLLIGTSNSYLYILNGIAEYGYQIDAATFSDIYPWSFLVLRKTGTTWELSINGGSFVQFTTSAATPSDAANNGIRVCAGVNTTTPTATNVGAIGEIMYFTSSVSLAQIKTLYDLTSKKYLYPVLPGQRSCE